MAWCEANGVDYLFGLARNPRLVAALEAALAAAQAEAEAKGRPARRYKDFLWSTRDSWSRRRRVVGKAEWTGGKAHTCFAKATCGSIRLKLLKIAALVRISVRRIKVAMASGCPYRSEFQAAHARLSAAAA